MKKLLSILLAVCLLSTTLLSVPLSAGATETVMTDTGSQSGKVLYLLGDSIGEGFLQHEKYVETKWIDYVVAENSYDAEKSRMIGESGLGIATRGVYHSRMVDWYLNDTDFSEADMVVISLGVNDWKNYDVTTDYFFERMAYVLGEIRSENPDCELYFFSPFNNKLTGDYDSYYATNKAGSQKKELCYSYSLRQFADLIQTKLNEAPLAQYNATFVNMTECASINRDTIRDGALFDRIHPTQATHIEMGKEIAPILRAHGHRMVEHPATDSSCADGNILYWSCSDCGKCFTDAYAENEVTESSCIIPASKPHDVLENPSWTWSGSDIDGYSSATVDVTCPVCDIHEKITVTPSKVHTSGKSVFTATATASNGQVFTDTKTVEGQTLYVVGDSVSNGEGAGGIDNSWIKKVIDINGYLPIGANGSRYLGRNGIGFTYPNPVSNIVAQNIVDETDFSNADVVAVALGIYDWTDTNVRSQRIKTFPAMYRVFSKIRQDNPTCEIYFILPFNNSKKGTYDSYYSLNTAYRADYPSCCCGKTLQEFVNLIKAEFDKSDFKALNVNLIDMLECDAINRETIQNGALNSQLNPTAATHTALANEIAPLLYAHGHRLTAHAAVPATCTAAGSSAYWSCDDCGKFFSDDRAENEIENDSWVLPSSHKLTAHAAVPATCTSDGGSAYWSCDNCGKFFSDKDGKNEIAENSWIIPATGHKLTAHAAVPATCTSDGGSAYWSCDKCGKFFSDKDGKNEIEENSWEIPAIAHNLTAHAAIAPTCTTAGNSAYWSCDNCDKFFSDKDGKNEIRYYGWLLPATGHKLIAHAAADPTCTSVGNSAYWSCEKCDKYYSDDKGRNEIAVNSWVIPMIAHTLTAHAAVPATCTSAGNSAYWSCDNCDKFFSDKDGKNEIAENSWVIHSIGHKLTAHAAVPATCTEAGNSAYWSCDNCGKFFSDKDGKNEIENNSWIIPATGHKLTAHAAVPATCAEAGNSAYWSCDICGKFFSDKDGENEIEHNSWIIPEKETHDAFGDPAWTWTGNDSDGYTAASVTVTCPVCGEQEIIPASVAKSYTLDSTVYTATAFASTSQEFTEEKIVDGQVFFTNYSLSLNGDIGVNYYLNLSGEQAEDAEVTFTWMVNDEECTFTTDMSDAPYSSLGYKLTCNLAPAEMSSVITATLTIDGEQAATTTYSARQYADVILTDEAFIGSYCAKYGQDQYDALTELIHAMLDFGSRAQIRFDKDKDNLVNRGTYTFTDTVTPQMIPVTQSDMKKDLTEYGLEYTGSTVVLVTKTSIRHYYKIINPTAFSAVENDVTFNGKHVDYTEKNEEIYFELSDISACDLDTVYTLHIGHTDYTYAVTDYIRNCLAKTGEDANANTQALVSAMYRYNQKANVFFGESIVAPEHYEYVQTSSTVRTYLNSANYDPADYSGTVITEYAPEERSLPDERPSGVTLTIKEEGTLTVDGYSQHVEPGSFTVYNVIPNTLTEFTVTNPDGKVVQWGTINPTHFLRQINTPTGRNIRDLGGWSCDGGTVKYGVLIRGGVPTAADREVLVNQCGIRTDIELRGKNDNNWTSAPPTASPLGDDIDYRIYDRYAWYSFGDKELWRQILGDIFDSVNNDKPVYFHCHAGADRTATVACLLEAVLGMSQSDIDKDYELTSFYTGAANDNTRRRNSEDWINMLNRINSRQGATFRDRAIKVVLEFGFTMDDINAFRAKMIDGIPEVLNVN